MKGPQKLRSPQWSILCGSIFLLALVTGASHAQLLEEVVVTAQKREQNLQDVGVSVTAFSGDQMQKLGFVESQDIIAQTPGLELLNYGGGSIVSFNIRGVGQNDFLAHQEAPVALYIDEAYQPSNITTRFSLFDIDRTEILRGPQGTLFGRNSTGGLVHFVTAKPTQELDGFVDVTLGEESRRRVEAAIGGGLTETVSGRVSMVYNGNNGLIENDIGPDQREADDYAVRGQLLIEPSDDLNIYCSKHNTPTKAQLQLAIHMACLHLMQRIFLVILMRTAIPSPLLMISKAKIKRKYSIYMPKLNGTWVTLPSHLSLIIRTLTQFMPKTRTLPLTVFTTTPSFIRWSKYPRNCA
ncbi:MAG: TonB-dependent receptor plug domain-containing protein [Gammaproteobacteria bacterium]|nr:TonB-dependent receptor plug domain-containing protein [Gammaproteobacteria bacterium]